MKKPFIFVILFVFYTHDIYSQAGDLRADTDFIFNDLNRLRSRDHRYENALGSPFYSSQWLEGSIKTSKGLFTNLKLNLNVFDGRLHYIYENREFAIALSDFEMVQIAGLNGSGQFFRSKFLDKNGNVIHGFFQILLEEKIGLVKLISKEYKPVDEFGNQSEFKDLQNFYMLMNGSVYLINSKDALGKLLPSKRDSVNQFIKVNKLKINNESNLIWIFRFLNNKTS